MLPFGYRKSFDNLSPDKIADSFHKAKGVVAIHGHTDAKGANDYNQSLSVRRAEAVHLWLVEKGGAQANYEIMGHGETQPVAPNTNPDGTDNPDGRAQNRRVEISIQAVTP